MKLSSKSSQSSVCRIIIPIAISLAVLLAAFVIWYRSDLFFGNDKSTDIQSVPINKQYLDNTVDQLFIYNGMNVDDSELLGLTTDNNAMVIANNLIQVVSNNSSNSKVVAALTNQNLSYVPAPSMVTVLINGQVVPMLLVDVDEGYVKAYNPMTTEVNSYPFKKFNDSYEDAGRQCVYITDRGY